MMEQNTSEAGIKSENDPRTDRSFANNNNSAKKYFLYAVGEIALVVLGILIALQINNWNEDYQQRQEELFYLSELQQDFEENRERMKEDEEYFKYTLGKISKTLAYMYQTLPDTVSSYELLRNFYGLSVPDLELNEGALNELLSTGKLSLISNHQLRRSLTEWTNKVEKANIHVTKILRFKEDQLRPYMISCCPMGEEYRKAHLEVFKDARFQTLLKLYELMLQTQMNLKRDPIIELIDTILEQIDTENIG